VPKSAWVAGIFLVFRKPLIYAVAGYGVFSWVKGGVIRNTGVFKRNVLCKNRGYLWDFHKSDSAP
jgi:hypothetical protein